MDTNQPQQNSVQASDGTPLDPSVVALAKSIRTVESNNNYSAKGKSGEYGAYQYTEPTWRADAGKYLGDSNADITNPVNQDKVIYAKILAQKQAGYTPEQVASEHNSGNKDAYSQNHVGTNQYGVQYNTPKYVQNVISQYDTLKNQYLQGQQSNPAQTTTTDNRDWLDKAADVLTSIFGGKQIGSLIGGLYDKATLPADEAQYVTLPKASQVLGDVAQVGLTAAAPAVGGEGLGLLGRLGVSTALGAGLGASNAVAQGKGGVGSSTLTGAGLGLAGGVVGEATNKLLSFLPKSFVQKALQGADSDSVQSLLEKPNFTLQGALDDTQQGIEAGSKQLDSLLNGEPAEEVGQVLKNGGPSQDIFDIPNATPKNYAGALGNGTDSLDKTLTNFQNSKFFSGVPQDVLDEGQDSANQYAQQKLIALLKNAVPEQATLLDKLASGNATLAEKNALRSELDSVTYDTRNPTSTFRKTVAKFLADALRGEVQGNAPESQPIFQELQKNINLRDALQTAIEKSSKSKGIGLKDIVNFLLGHAYGGTIGGLASAGGLRALGNPTADLAAARGVQALTPIISATGRLGKAPLMNTLISGLSGK